MLFLPPPLPLLDQHYGYVALFFRDLNPGFSVGGLIWHEAMASCQGAPC
jgi:hypothetical protein